MKALRQLGRILSLLGVLAAAVAVNPGGVPAAAAPTARAGVAAPQGVISPVLTCEQLNPLDIGGTDVRGPGTRPRPGVPDFANTPGAPTRISSATLVAATPSTPEHCDVQGYVASQIHFDLKLPTRTWQGRYMQHACAGFCGNVFFF